MSAGDARALLRSPLTLLLLAALVSGLVLAVSGGARAALRASVTRQDQPYVALAFADLDTLRECGNGVPLTVGFTLGNHLGEHADVDYALSVVSRRDDGTGRVVSTVDGTASVADGATASVARAVTTPRTGDYDVVVQLVGDLATRDQSVAVRCAETS